MYNFIQKYTITKRIISLDKSLTWLALSLLNMKKIIYSFKSTNLSKILQKICLERYFIINKIHNIIFFNVWIKLVQILSSTK